MSSGCEWYTPPEVVEMARSLMGDIDLDPASSVLANTVVKALRFHDAEEDGLLQPWNGRLWINPPFRRGQLAAFTGKALATYQSGEVSEACILVPFIGQSAWFLDLIESGAPAILVRKKIRFWCEDNTHRWPIVIFYLGKQPMEFLRCFGSLGTPIAKLTEGGRLLTMQSDQS